MIFLTLKNVNQICCKILLSATKLNVSKSFVWRYQLKPTPGAIRTKKNIMKYVEIISVVKDFLIQLNLPFQNYFDEDSWKIFYG